MSKGNRNSTQRFYPEKPPVQTREKMPIAVPTKDGIELHCPFCADAHVLRPNTESPCGTRVVVTAVQEVVTSKYAKQHGLICIKCHQGGGEMIKYRDSYIHLVDCVPEKRLLQDIPKFSKFAEFVSKTNPRVRGIIERFTGRADHVIEIDEQGNETGKVLGYFFYPKSKVKKHAQSQPVRA